MQTKAGSLKARDTNIRKYGKDFYKVQGHLGGIVRNENTPRRGFGSATPEQRSNWGKIGGSLSSRKGVKDTKPRVAKNEGTYITEDRPQILNIIQASRPINNSIWDKVYTYIKRNK